MSNQCTNLHREGFSYDIPNEVSLNVHLAILFLLVEGILQRNFDEKMRCKRNFRLKNEIMDGLVFLRCSPIISDQR